MGNQANYAAGSHGINMKGNMRDAGQENEEKFKILQKMAIFWQKTVFLGCCDY